MSTSVDISETGISYHSVIFFSILHRWMLYSMSSRNTYYRARHLIWITSENCSKSWQKKSPLVTASDWLKEKSLSSSFFLPVGDLPLSDVQKLPEEDWHGRTSKPRLRFRRRGWERSGKEREEEGQGPPVRHPGRQVLQIWHQAWVDDDPPHHQPQVR